MSSLAATTSRVVPAVHARAAPRARASSTSPAPSALVNRDRPRFRSSSRARRPRSVTSPAMETASAAETAETDVSRGMTDLEKYLFDLNGFLVVRGVFSEAEVAAANAAIDKRSERIVERKGDLRLGGDKDSPLAGDGVTGREDLGGMLGWAKGEREVFRDVLTHPKLVPYYHALIGQGYRMDHLPLLIQQNPGADGFVFHGGKMNDDGSWCDDLSYTFNNGRMYNRLLAVSVALTETKPGDGGFCVIRGSHKANLPCPPSMQRHEVGKDFVENPELKPGDVLLFSEATTHGTLPWSAKHTRRACLYRFAPATSAYGRAYMTSSKPSWPEDMMKDLTEAQSAVLEAPYHPRLDRPSLLEDGSVAVTSRADFKKEHDAKVFGSKYF